jgi:hypothetical protein
MAQKEPTVPDHIAWALNTQARATRTCSTCEKYPKLLPIIEDLTKMQLDGKTSVSRTQIFDMLCEKYGYGLRKSSLDRHVNECVMPKLTGDVK